MVWRHWNILGLKNHTSKIYKIYKSSCIIFFIKIFWYLQIICCQYTLKSFLPLPTRFCFLPTLSAKMGSISFLSSSSKHQSHHLVRCHAAGVNPLLISFLNAFRCLNLLCQAISPILTSKLMLWRSLLRMPISSLGNVILQESLSKRSISSSVNKAL